MQNDRGLRIVYYPVFSEPEDLTDTYFRAVWYFHAVRHRIAALRMLCANHALKPLDPPPYLDDSIAKLAPHSADFIEFQYQVTVQDVEKELSKADMVLIWRTDCSESDLLPAGRMQQILQEKRFYSVDPRGIVLPAGYGRYRR